MSKIKKTKYEIFNYGSSWIRADFHLHTISDKEFQYDGNSNEFNKEFIQRLKETDINFGVITNHNKFNLNEFKDLRNKALKEEIYLLPWYRIVCKRWI